MPHIDPPTVGDPPLSLGERLRRERKRRRQSQDDAAAVIGISRNYLSQLEHDDANPTADMLGRLGDYLGDVPLLFDMPNADERAMVVRMLAAYRAGFVIELIRPPTAVLPIVGADVAVFGVVDRVPNSLLED